MVDKLFPPELLYKSNEERHQYFKDLKLGHEKLGECLKEVLLNIHAGSGIIFIMGPSGVGKKVIRLKTVEALLKENYAEMQSDIGFIPVASITSKSPEVGPFKWKSFYVRALEALNEPLISHKIKNCQGTCTPIKFFHGKQDTDTLGESLIKALCNRRTKVLIVDEAQHLLRVATGAKYLNQLDVIKGLSEATGVTLVLLGTYELLPLWNLSAQTTRRSVAIEFQRYYEDEMQQFGNFLYTINRKMPVVKVPDFTDYIEFFYKRSMGCIGIVKTWLERALWLALEEGMQELKIEHLKKTSLSPYQCKMMLAESITGENQYRTIMGPGDFEEDFDQAIEGNHEETYEDKNEPRAKPQKRRPGRRRPIRDTVGTGIS